MVENNVSIQLTEEQLEIIRQSIKTITESFKIIIEKIAEIVHYIFEWAKEILDTEIKIVKIKKKSKRYIPYVIKEKLYLYMERIKA